MKIAALLLLAPLAFTAVQTPTSAGLCPSWSPPEKAGALDMAQLSNTSGLAASTALPGRLYHHNDAQGGPVFFVSDETGQNLRKVTVAGFTPLDLESVDAGPCQSARSCVYLADFGDNAVNRATMTFAVLPEKDSYGETEPVLRTITARYPDGPHNAEAMAVHPYGEIFVLTKINRGEPATILYRLQYGVPALVRTDPPPTVLTEVARIDLGKLMAPANGPSPARMAQATGMDIAPDGKTFVVLTYSGAVEVNFDLSRPLPPQSEWVEGRDYRLITTATLPQAEGIAYSADGKSILYTSEYMRGGPESPIMRQRCLR